MKKGPEFLSVRARVVPKAIEALHEEMIGAGADMFMRSEEAGRAAGKFYITDEQRRTSFGFLDDVTVVWLLYDEDPEAADDDTDDDDVDDGTNVEDPWGYLDR